MRHPFAKLMDLRYLEQRPGFSRCSVVITEKHLNPNHVVHGAVIFALADVGMGSAVHLGLAKGELICTTTLINCGKTLANLDSTIHCGEQLVAKANGTYAIFRPSQPKD